MISWCFLFIKEHEKRCWSVDFNTMDPKLLASGSDDAKGIDVKIPLNSLKLQYIYIYHYLKIECQVRKGLYKTIEMLGCKQKKHIKIDRFYVASFFHSPFLTIIW